ncbi:hypothetical protein ACXLNZ_003927, partial [Escherichia coli]
HLQAWQFLYVRSISTLVSVFCSCFFSFFSVNVLHFVPLVYVPGLKSSGRMRPDVVLFGK